MPVCTSVEDIQVAIQEVTHLKKPIPYIIQDWPGKDKLENSMGHYWSIRSEFEMIDGIAMKGKRKIIPFLLQKQIPQ